MIRIKERKFIEGLEYINNELAHGIYVNSRGDVFWYQNGKRHRNDDKPAIVFSDGTRHWYRNDKLHRDNDKPAVVCDNGDMFWYRDGKFMREDNKPAVIYYKTVKHHFENHKKNYENKNDFLSEIHVKNYPIEEFLSVLISQL